VLLLFQFSEIIIPTMDTVRQSYFLQLYISHETPQLYVGPTGTGKSAITNSFLIQLPKEKSVLSIMLLLSHSLLAVVSVSDLMSIATVKFVFPEVGTY